MRCSLISDKTMKLLYSLLFFVFLYGCGDGEGDGYFRGCKSSEVVTDPNDDCYYKNSAVITGICGNKRSCGEMFDCEEAKFYFNNCGVSELDANGDRLPCNILCDGNGGTKPQSTQSTVNTTPNSDCGYKQTCSDMSNCQEAEFYLNSCGLSTLDGDGDGIPCETLCK